MTGRMNSLCAKPELLHHSQGIKRKIIECDFILRKNKMLERTFREKWRNHTKAIYFRKKKTKKKKQKEQQKAHNKHTKQLIILGSGTFIYVIKGVKM